MNEQMVVLEKNKRYSDAALWAAQREYFDTRGIDAWVEQVPFYVTSNPYIADTYAQLFVAFMRDWVAKHPESINDPFYIMELGTGSGRFSFFTLKRICELVELYGLEGYKFCYVMTDFTQSNLDFWNQHDVLKSYVEKGVLDFALYNMEIEQTIELDHQKITLSPDTLKNPLTVYANYIFDTVSHDVFKIENGRLFESLVTLETPKSNMVDGKVQSWEQVSVNHKVSLGKNNYYDDPVFNKVLDDYRDELNDTHITFPLGGLNAIKLLRKLSNDRLFIVSSDKAYSQFNDIKNLNPPRIDFHGSFSIMVNYDAMKRYFVHAGGDAVLPGPHEGIDSCIFGIGVDIDTLPETRTHVSKLIKDFTPADYFALHRNISENFEHCNLKSLASHMAFTRFDPHIFQRIHSTIYGLLESSDSSSVEKMLELLPRIADHFFMIPKTYDVFFDIGILYHATNNYEEAFKYYSMSEKYFGDQYGIYYNRGLCLASMEKKDEALKFFKRATILDPTSEEAHEWVKHIEEESSVLPPQ